MADPVLMQMLMARQKPQGALAKLRAMLPGRSAAGAVDMRTMYNQYVTQAMQQGVDPVDFETFVVQMQNTGMAKGGMVKNLARAVAGRASEPSINWRQALGYDKYYYPDIYRQIENKYGDVERVLQEEFNRFYRSLQTRPVQETGPLSREAYRSYLIQNREEGRPEMSYDEWVNYWQTQGVR